MISLNDFEGIVEIELKRRIKDNPQQRIAIESPQNNSLFIVAAPEVEKLLLWFLRF